MKFLTLAITFLPLLAASAPTADPDPEANVHATANTTTNNEVNNEIKILGELDTDLLNGESGLEKRASARSCKIVNVDHYVNCRYQPSLEAGEIFGFPRDHKFTFACWKHGDCYNGVCSWDQITYLKTTCYVNGYFTDSNCSSKKLPKCK